MQLPKYLFPRHDLSKYKQVASLRLVHIYTISIEDIMHIVMNNFKIKIGREEEFEEVWRNRDSYLEGVPGFRFSFN